MDRFQLKWKKGYRTCEVLVKMGYCSMYQDFEDPWEQSTREVFSLEKKIGIELLKKYQHQKPLEYGCGLGYYTRKLAEHFEEVYGVDVSETAIKKARSLHQVKSILWQQIYFVKTFF